MGETKEIERSVQMRLYSLHKRQFVGVFIVFFISLFVTLLIGLAGPTVIESKEYQPESPSKQLSGPYTLPIDYLDKFHQRLWLTMKPITDTTDEFRQTINITITVNNPSSSSNPSIYQRQRTIHCQKKVSKQERKKRNCEGR